MELAELHVRCNVPFPPSPYLPPAQSGLEQGENDCKLPSLLYILFWNQKHLLQDLRGLLVPVVKLMSA
jgi:hypothetical protein